MPITISNQVIDCPSESNQFISESQLALSQSFQSFCKEATSCSALFGLAAGQTVALLAKAQSYKFLTSFCRTTSSRLPIYYSISSSIALIAEGISFPLASQLGRSEKLEIGNLGQNIHGILTIALCKTLGKKNPINNYLFQHALQDCALVTLDLGCEQSGLIERKKSSFVERILEAEIASIRIETSAKLLAISCVDFSILQAKHELDRELQENLKTVKRVAAYNPLMKRIEPTALTSNGLLMKMSTVRENAASRFSIHAKDYIMMATGKMQEDLTVNVLHNAGENHRDILKVGDYVELLPKTARKQLKEVATVNEGLASLLGEMWGSVCEKPLSLKDVRDRAGLIDYYHRAARSYLKLEKKYSDEKVIILTELGFNVFFKNVPDTERFHIEDSLDTSLEDFDLIHRNDPELAQRIKIALAGWSEELEMFKKLKSPFLKEIRESRARAFEIYEAIASRYLKNLIPFETEVSYQIALWEGFRFRRFHKEILSEISQEPYSLKMSDYRDSRPFDLLNLHKTPRMQELHRRTSFEQLDGISSYDGNLIKRMIASQEPLKTDVEALVVVEESLDPIGVPENSSKKRTTTTQRETDVIKQRMALEDRIAMSRQRSDPESALSVFSQAITVSEREIGDLREYIGELDRLVKILTSDDPSNHSLEADTFLEIKSAFDTLGIEFDSARFYRALCPIVTLFKGMSGEVPSIEITENQFKKAHFYNLGAQLLAHRLNGQKTKGSEENLTGAKIAEKLEKVGGTLQRYEMNIIHIVEDKILVRAIDEVLKLPQEEREIAYLASRPEITELIPIFIIQADGSRKRLDRKQIDQFRSQRAAYLNADSLRKEIAQALTKKGIIEKKDKDTKRQKKFEDYLKRLKLNSAKAKKLLIVGDHLSDEEVEIARAAAGIDDKKWRRHFDRSVDGYFLGFDEQGNVRYPKMEDFEKLKKIPPCTPKLMADKYPEVSNWERLTLEEKWHLYILQILLNKFRTSYGAAKESGISSVNNYGGFRNSILNRTWTVETLAQFANACELPSEERALLYMYFKQERLLKKI